MENARTRNDLGAALVRFCVAIEDHRRTPDGRVRTPAQFLAHFFSTEGGAPKDEVFRHMPKEVRGPILSAWGIRGSKAALRDDDAKVASVVFDALAAGDLDDAAFESALGADKLLAWIPLASFWSFWRAGAITKPALLKALSTAYELRLLDARMFFETLKARGGELTGTDVLGHSFTKDDLIEWMRKVHASGDGSPKGILEAVGWEKIAQKAPTEALLGALDALAARLGLAEAPPAAPAKKDEPAETPAGAEVEFETSESAEVAVPKTDPPSAPPENVESWSPPATDLAKTGPYATPITRAKPATDEDEDSDEETKLYRSGPPLRR
ncbi:MAG TPA: hypothetical protein VGH28_34235 [Polyangiaceae bacterium]|jgi:hypothetical protein